MDMIGHDDVGVKLVPVHLLFPIANSIDRESRDRGAAEMERTGAGVIEESIHSQKGLSGGGLDRENAIEWQAAVEPPSEEYWVLGGV
ncbi:hypothetical protein SBA4_1650013 [Candidatus Sulfopaludibacter sp. SbA4]|nr:hypothetical protein SBA4_1650013 [Candidatus Sulfopaludibacter sp. SbA4]